MLKTVNLDDGLILQAQTITGVREKSALLREALKALIERESAKRVAANPDDIHTSRDPISLRSRSGT